MPLTNGLKGSLLILASATLMSLGGVGVKLCEFGPWKMAGLRSGIAAIAVCLMVREARRHWSWRVWPVGAAMATTMICFVWGTKLTTAANTIFIQSSAPLWILLLGPLLIHERIHVRDAVSIIVFGIGLALFFIHPSEPTTLSPKINTGNLIALLAGVSFALCIIGLRSLRGRGAEAAVVCGNAMAFVVCLPMMIVGEGPETAGYTPGSWRSWLVLIFLGSVQIGLAYALYARGVRYVRAIRASLIGLVEPALNPLWVFLMFRQERPGRYALLGGALILAATGYQVLVRPKHRAQSDHAARVIDQHARTRREQ